MNGKLIIDEILNLQKKHEELHFIRITSDENYPNQYTISYNLEEYIDELEDGDIYEQTVYIDTSKDYDYNMKYIIYFKVKFNGEKSMVYYTKVLNQIEGIGNNFIIDFINNLLIINK